jgi:hypothetical protein
MRYLISSAKSKPRKVKPIFIMHRATLSPQCIPGKGTSFYSWLDVPSTASTAQISKAYRRKSMLLQCVQTAFTFCPPSCSLTFLSPDKNPGVKGIHERFARLGVIASILRDPVGRERLVVQATFACCECVYRTRYLDMIIFTKTEFQDGEGQDIITRVGDRACRWVIATI